MHFDDTMKTILFVASETIFIRYVYIYSSKHIFRFVRYFITHFKKKALKFILTHTFLVLVTVGLGNGIYRKMYTFIGVNVQKSLRTTGVEEPMSRNQKTRNPFCTEVS